MILKATEGSSYTDRTWESRTKAALVAGLAVSSYHFLRPSQNMRGQIDHYLGVIDRLMPLGARVCLDHEDDGVLLADLEFCVSYLGDQRPDLQIAVYSGHLLKDQLAGQTSKLLATKTDLWIAQYTSAAAPSWPEQVWPHWSVWQWTDKETVAGIAQPVDGNRFAGTSEELLEWFGRPVKAIPIEPPIVAEAGDRFASQILKINGKEVVVQIDPLSGEVTVHVNGEPWGPVNV